MSNDSAGGRRCASSGAATGRSCRRAPLGLAALLLVLVPATAGAFTLDGFDIRDPAIREVVEAPTIVHPLQPIHYSGTPAITEWLLDRPVLSAILVRHLYPPVERYHITDAGQGRYAVDDQGALRGQFWLVAHQDSRRVYFCRGTFRSLARLVALTGRLVFTLEYHQVAPDGGPAMEAVPTLYVQLDNAVAHGVMKTLSPLLHGIIERRVENLKIATQILGRRITLDPQGLYREMQSWSDLPPGQLEEYHRAFLRGGGRP